MAVQVAIRYLTGGTRLGGVTGWRPRGDPGPRRAKHTRPGRRLVWPTGSATSGGQLAHPRVFSTEVETSVEFFIGGCAQRGYEEAWPSSRRG